MFVVFMSPNCFVTQGSYVFLITTMYRLAFSDIQVILNLQQQLGLEFPSLNDVVLKCGYIAYLTADPADLVAIVSKITRRGNFLPASHNQDSKEAGKKVQVPGNLQAG